MGAAPVACGDHGGGVLAGVNKGHVFDGPGSESE